MSLLLQLRKQRMRRGAVVLLLMVIGLGLKAQFNIISDGTWKASSTFQNGWTSPKFNDNSWGLSTAPSPNPFPGFPVVPGSQSMWITPYTDSVYFRKSFELRSNCVTATIAQITCDNEYYLFVNGLLVGSNKNASINYHNIQPSLKIGLNTIAILAIDWNPPFLLSFKTTINLTSGPIIDLGVDKYVCQGDSTNFTTNHSYRSYMWSNGDTRRTGTMYKGGTYHCTAVDSNGCNWVDTVQLYEYKHKFVDLGPDTSTCTGDVVTLDAGAYDAYEWSTGDQTRTIDVNYAGLFGVKVTDGNGCQSESSKAIVVFDHATVNLGEDSVLCKGDSMTLKASFPYSTYQWSTGSTDTSIVITKPGVYGVTITNHCGRVTDDVQVEFIDEIKMSLGSDAFFCYTDRYELKPEVIGAAYYAWTTGDSTESIVVTETGTYGVEVGDLCGNTGYDEVEIITGVKQKDMIPNSFSPNRDGINETWRAYIRPTGDYEITVINKWGNEVFHSHDPAELWDGKNEGNELPAGKYLYKVEFINCQNQKEISTGMVTLIR